MDYEKKYKEALERARANYKADKEMGFLENCDMLELIFPELAESEDEDERIRKELIEYHKQQFEKNRDQEVGLFHNAAIAYLERQKEQKPAWSEEDEEILDGIINTLDRLGYAEFCKSSREEDIEEERFYYKEIQCLKKLKSLRPSWKPSEEQMDALRRAVNKLAKTDIADSVRLSVMSDNLKKL